MKHGFESWAPSSAWTLAVVFDERRRAGVGDRSSFARRSGSWDFLQARLYGVVDFIFINFHYILTMRCDL